MPETAAAYLPDRLSLSGLRSSAAGCRACPLWQTATQTVFGAGRASAAVMLVGEQPGDQEDAKGCE
jgi:DNA polymerase